MGFNEEESWPTCPACDGRGCDACDHKGVVHPDDFDTVVEGMEEERAETESLLATARDEDFDGDVDPLDWEGNVYGPGGEPAMSADELESMFRWYEEHTSDPFACDVKGRA